MKAAGLALSLVLTLLLAFGCQSIAGVEDVSFSANTSACASYCDTLSEACPGDVAVYDDRETCMNVCALFKPGTASKPQGNTLACRADQAETALRLSSDLTENRPNCAAAGPGGDKKCTIYPKTPDCEGYCTVYMGACTDSKKWGFKTFDQCVSQCAAFPNKTSYTAADGKEGDSLACRLHHATLAIADPDNNCESAGSSPAKACVGIGVPDCDDYCRVNQVACTDMYQVYEDTPQCLAVCAVTAKGTRGDSGGKAGQDTIGCRLYHSYFALLLTPTPHCSHSGPAGDGVCSDDGANHPNCSAFCNLLKNGCPDKFQDLHDGSEDDCVEKCETLDDAHTPGGNLYSIDAAQSGNTLKCRTLNAVRALAKPGADETPGYCEAAIGGPPCQ